MNIYRLLSIDKLRTNTTSSLDLLFLEYLCKEEELCIPLSQKVILVIKMPGKLKYYWSNNEWKR